MALALEETLVEMDEYDLDAEGERRALLVIGSPEWLTHEYDPGGTTLVDACTLIKNFIQLDMLRTV